MAVTETSAVVLSEAIMQTGMCGDLSIVQVSTMHVSVHLKMDDVWIENTRLLVRGIAVADSSFIVWDGKAARSCTINPQSHRSTLNEPFPTTSRAMAIADSKHLTDDALFIAENGVVKVTNYSGVQKATITFSDSEGKPEFIHLNGKYLYVMTSNLVIKIYDVQKPTSPKALGSVMKFTDINPDTSKGSKLKVRSICGNNTGSRLAVMTSHVEGSLQLQHPDTRLHIYDRIKGSINVHDFAQESRYPSSAHWDNFDSRLIVVEAVRMQQSKADASSGPEVPRSDGKTLHTLDTKDVASKKTAEVEGENEFEITLLFASSEHGILLQDSFPRVQPYGDLIGINVPSVIFRNYVNPLSKGDGTPNPRSNSVRLYAKTMRDFVGIDKVDDNTKFALLEFSFNLTLGKLDEAYRAVKAIDSPFIWENMAQMCVKTRRLDVAEVCLGNMGHARGAAALRESMKEGNAEVSIGVLAIQLGLLDDAAKLFRESGRFDLLNNLYQAAGQWDKAVHLAKQKDRIHLKTTHYHYAKYLESIGDVSQAIRHYEDSDTFRTEVPRMLYTTGQIEDLEEYVHSSKDVVLLKWWAAYLESKERYDKARKYYNKAGDHLSLVRILCFQGEFQKAADIVNDTKSNAATYHFARQLEAQGELQEAIRYYASSGCYNHAIRLAKSYGMDSELMTFAIKATPSLMLDCAAHFEMKGDYEKAVQLYHKGGDYLHALDICFKAGQGGDGGKTREQKQSMFDMLNTIAQDLGVDSSPQTLARCAEFLVIHKQFEKAVELYIMAKRYPQAIEMCAQHRVTISETMATTLTPPTEGFDSSQRKEILADLGRALKKQGSFILASKKYTQAGDRIRAMKCLLRGGDTKAVIQFASISRNAEIYKLAANYLQQMDWREADIMKAIIMFYSKAKAFEQLSGFYDSCAQVGDFVLVISSSTVY
jgi:intraflagellar transport protein 140